MRGEGGIGGDRGREGPAGTLQVRSPCRLAGSSRKPEERRRFAPGRGLTAVPRARVGAAVPATPRAGRAELRTEPRDLPAVGCEITVATSHPLRSPSRKGRPEPRRWLPGVQAPAQGILERFKGHPWRRSLGSGLSFCRKAGAQNR